MLVNKKIQKKYKDAFFALHSKPLLKASQPTTSQGNTRLPSDERDLNNFNNFLV